MRIGIDASRAFVNEPTGTERYSFELITRLVTLSEAKDHEWILYTKKPITKEQFPNNVTNIQIPMKYLWTQVGLAVRTWLDNIDMLWVPAHTLPVLRNPRIKTVVTIHGIEYEWLPAYENLLQRWYLPLSTKYAVGVADKVIAVSQFTKNQLIQRLGADAKKINVIYEGVAENVHLPTRLPDGEVTDYESVLKKFKLQKGKYLLFIGTIQPRKNLERLIRVFKELKRKNLKLVICGKWGWGYDSLHPLADDQIIFTGYVDDTIRLILLKNALIYVQPSITEGFGLPVIEAIRNSIPTVISNGGALPELVPNPWPTFDPLSAEDMANKLKTVIDDPKLREEMILRGKVKIKEFTWDQAASKTYSLLININDKK